MNSVLMQQPPEVAMQPAAIKLRRKALGATLLLCAAGIVINMGGLQLALLLGLPLYIDSVGTIFAAAAGGYLPGVVVGFLTNALASISSPTTAYYGSLNVLIAVVTAFAARRNWLKKPSALLGLVLTYALIGGGLGSVLTWLLNGLQIGDDITTDLSHAILERSGMGVFWSLFLANLLIDLADKAVVLPLSLLLLRATPQRWIELFQTFGWQQTPLNAEEKAAATKRFSRAMSLRSKILILIAAATVLIACSAAVISYILYSRATLGEQTNLSQGVADLAASIIDGDRVGEFIALGEEADGYRETEERLYRIRESSPSIEYVYVYKITYEGCRVVFDLDTEDLEGDDPGTLIHFDEAFRPYLPTLYAGGRIDPIISNETYGWLLTAYSPVYDSYGVCQCYAAADISMTELTASQYAFIAKILSLFFGFLIFVLAVALWLAEYNITLPINTMALAAGSFAYNSETARKGSIDRIHGIGIRTGDEIENLYTAFEKTTEDTVRYITDVQEKNDEISKLQSGLLLVLADVVESRDHCTGDHIKKTAAYVRIIMEQMRRDGIYADRLTDKFIEDVTVSAPLHDIGKIQVPDAILNKPGKLTDEEYTRMKNHTTYGSNIIGRAIDAVGGDSSGYLSEAQNLAAYHHERWDGTGYPNRLAGEDIPLSARIMAVADVFDALVSRRSYKQGRSTDSVIDAIREGSGTHFDPKIVEAFLHAEKEIRRTAETYSDDDPAAS